MTSSKTRTAVVGALAIPLVMGAVAVPAAAQEAPAPQATATSTVTASGKGRDAIRKPPPSRGKAPHRFGTVKYNKWYARNYMDHKYDWGRKHYKSLVKLWNRESGWNHRAHNGSSGAHGIPQALPGSKMASHGPNWRSNPETQIKWGLSYIKGRYQTPTGAWKAFQNKGWY